MILINLLIWLIAITVAITVHEFAHAFISDRLGDPTARLKNRLSLNPLDHYDQVGTTMLLVTSLMRALGAPVMPFGWAKPVEYDPYNLRNPKRDTALIALAGPVTNILLTVLTAVICIYIIKIPSELIRFVISVPNEFLMAFENGQVSFPEYFSLQLIASTILINLSLAIFNLVPIHPLDGSKIILGILPDDIGNEYEIIMHRYGLFLLIFLIIPLKDGISPLNALISPIFNFALNLLR